MNVYWTEKSMIQGSDAIDNVVQNWHKITVKNNDYYEISVILAWCLENCNYKFWNKGQVFYFYDERDATVFALKYG